MGEQSFDVSNLSEREREKLFHSWATEDSIKSLGSSDLLAEVICPEHKYFPRFGQVSGFNHDQFIGDQPLYKVGLKRVEDVIWRAVVIVNFRDEILAVPRECCRIFEKQDLKDEDIEVVDEIGRVGKLLGWERGRRDSSVKGVYKAEFGARILSKQDWLMRQEPSWQFKRKI